MNQPKKLLPQRTVPHAISLGIPRTILKPPQTVQGSTKCKQETLAKITKPQLFGNYSILSKKYFVVFLNFFEASCGEILQTFSPSESCGCILDLTQLIQENETVDWHLE